MYLPTRADQIDGTPAFDFPGVVNGYFVSAFTPIPGNDAMSKQFTLHTASQVMLTSINGAQAMTAFAVGIAASVAALLF